MKGRLGVLAFVAVLLLGLALPALAIAAPITIEDTAFTYSGTWMTYSDPAMSGGGNHYASYTASPGAYGETTFTGTDVTFISTIGPNRGDVAIYLDGVYEATVSEYNASVVYQQALWSKSGLASQSHTIRFVCLGTGPGVEDYAEIDAITYENIPVIPTTSTPASSIWSLALTAILGVGLVLAVQKRRTA